MDGCTDGKTDRWMIDRKGINERKEEWDGMDGQLVGRMEEWIDRWTDGGMDR